MRALEFVTLALLSSAATVAQEPALGIEECLELVLPSSEETAFDRLGWRPALAAAALEADVADRPVLLWAMNGHPLGCT